MSEQRSPSEDNGDAEALATPSSDGERAGRNVLGQFAHGNRYGHGNPHVRAERPSAGVGRDPRSRSGVRRYRRPVWERHKSR